MATVTVEPEAGRTARPRTRQQLARVIGLVAVLDVAMVTAAVPVALLLRFGTEMWHASGIVTLTGEPVLDFGWVVPLWLGTLAAQDAYSRRKFARGAEEFKTVLRASITAALIGAMACYLIHYDLSRGFYFWFFMVATPLLLLERYAVNRGIARMRHHDRLLHRVVLVGDAAEVTTLQTMLSKHPELGYTVVAVVDAPDTAVEACATHAADTLLVASGGAGSSAGLRRIGWQLADSDIDLVVVPSLIDVAGPRIHTRPVSGLPFMHIEPPQADRAMKWGKALFDRVGALVLLLVLSPVFLLVAITVRLDSSGPVFFRQCRVGARGETFGLWKFRSMVPEAEALRQGLSSSTPEAGPLFKVHQDPRLTRVGAVLRRYSLDELPQLFNVLRGEMSLVGPRPPLPSEVALYVDADHRRLMVRPGLTGLWQVSGRSNLSWEESVRLDLSYVDNWSMTGDLVILFKTVRAVLRHEGAY